MHDRISCFVIMPYSRDTDRIYEQGILAALRSIPDREVLALRADQMAYRDITLKAHIEGAVQTADFCIADITGSNPNVMYELGFAVANQKPVVIIRQASSGEAPADLRGLRTLDYDPADLRSFVPALSATVQQISVLSESGMGGKLVRGFSSNLLGDPQIIAGFAASVRFALSAVVGSPRFFAEQLLPLVRPESNRNLLIRVVCADPEGEYVRMRALDSDRPVGEYRNEFRTALQLLHARLRSLVGVRAEVRVTQRVIGTSMYLADDIALILPYLQAGSSREIVGIFLPKGSDTRGFALFVQQFGRLWSEALRSPSWERGFGAATDGAREEPRDE